MYERDLLRLPPPGPGALLLPTLLLLSVLGGGCEPDARPLIGISTSPRFVDAVRLALEDAGPDGADAVDTLVIAEAANRAAPAITAAGEFVSRDGLIAVVGHSNSAASLAASQIYNEREVVQIAPQSSATVYSDAGPYSFRLVPPDSRQGPFLAESVQRFLPEGGRVALLYVNDDYGRGLRSSFLEALDQRSFPVVTELPHTEDTPVRDEIELTGATVRDARPDVVVLLARASILDGYMGALRRAAPDAVILGADAVATGRDLAVGDGRWQGVRFVSFVDMEGTAALRNFARRWEERTGTQASGPDALTYDATALVLAGVAAGARSGPEMREYLESLGRERPAFDGLTGPIVFDRHGDVDRSYVLDTIGERGGG